MRTSFGLFAPRGLLPLAFSLGAAACGGSASTGGDGGAPDLTPAAACTHTVVCTDQSVQQLSLYRPANAATVDNTSAGGVFTSTIDATGGGLDPTKSYVYVKLGDGGMTRVEVGDEDAFASTDWDLAFRRFIIRLNSGVAGPSCVTAARIAAATDFDALAAVPEGLDFRTESYFTDSCDYVPDGSGLGSPGTALQSFWEYPGCVKMTGNVFVIALADGRHVKLQVLDYYAPATQEECNTNGSVTASTGAGTLVVKWAFLP